MALDLYTTAIPLLTRYLRNLDRFLDAAIASAQGRGFDPEQLVQARLAPDMLPLARQIQIASDNAKGCAARLTGAEAPVFADTETTLAELKQRIARTLDYLAGVPPEAYAGAEQRHIVLKFPSLTLEYSGTAYVLEFVLPNFLFHVTTAYAILRHNGVPLGKRDFLAA